MVKGTFIALSSIAQPEGHIKGGMRPNVMQAV